MKYMYICTIHIIVLYYIEGMVIAALMHYDLSDILCSPEFRYY